MLIETWRRLITIIDSLDWSIVDQIIVLQQLSCSFQRHLNVKDKKIISNFCEEVVSVTRTPRDSRSGITKLLTFEMLSNDSGGFCGCAGAGITEWLPVLSE